MQIINSKNIDREKWDTCISNSSIQLPYALSWYLDAVAENWEGCIYKDYEIVFPVVWRSKLGVKLVYTPYFCQQLGFFGNGEFKSDFVEEVDNYLKSFFFIDLNLNYTNTQLHISDLYEKPNYILKLNRTYSEISISFSRDLKKCIRSAERSGLIAEKVHDYSIFLEYYFLFLNKEKLKIKDKHLELIKRLIKESFNRNLDNSYLVKKPTGEVIFCLFTLQWQNRIFNLMADGTQEGRNLRANHFIINKIIYENAESDVVLDFEGSSIQKVAEFFLKFGPEDQPFVKISRKITNSLF